ncbi:MAG TPA: sigma-70 family RNA polymerase sigma factor [Planctomycetota bacterium]|nr:sigma-70 family RNA polymerase sigma factor [Planctomycetota bacterium]
MLRSVSDLELVKRIQQGDEAAFTECVRRHQDSVRGFTALWAPSADEADDLAQEVFLAALCSINTFDTSRDFKAWLLGIARNQTRQAWRRVNRNRSSGSEPLEAILERHAVAVHTERENSADRRTEALQRCIGGLPERSRNLFSGYVVDELSSRELAESFQSTESAIRRHISRIRLALRDCVERRLQAEAAR